jgi:uncharacterized protein YdaU (DUF1376 family)
MHYFQFNIGDYASHTRHLSLMEDLAYRRLLDLYYLRDGQLYGNESEVARQIGMRDHVDDVRQVLIDFFILDVDGKWMHHRCDAEITHFRQKSEKASNAGKASAERRSNVRSTDVQPTNNQEPITKNQQPELSSNEDMSSGDDLTVDDVIQAWNDLADDAGLARVAKVTPQRRKQIQARIKEYDADDWSKAMGAIYRSKFLRGENDRGWKADFDFLLQPKSFIKLVEGSYDR